MRPRKAANCFADNLTINAKHMTQNFISHSVFDSKKSGFPDSIVSKFGRSLLFASSSSIALIPVSRVVPLRSCYQMIRPNARRVVTRVTYYSTLWYRSMLNQVRKTMSLVSEWLQRYVITIAIRISLACPEPAGICLFNTKPEVSNLVSNPTLSVTVVSAKSSFSSWMRKKLSSTLFASLCYRPFSHAAFVTSKESVVRLVPALTLPDWAVPIIANMEV